MVATASTELTQKTQARYMGLLADSDIRALRERLSLSQDQLSDLLGCGKKSLSRWENGREYPSQTRQHPAPAEVVFGNVRVTASAKTILEIRRCLGNVLP